MPTKTVQSGSESLVLYAIGKVRKGAKSEMEIGWLPEPNSAQSSTFLFGAGWQRRERGIGSWVGLRDPAAKWITKLSTTFGAFLGVKVTSN